MTPELVRVSPARLCFREAADAAARALLAISVTGRFDLRPADPLNARISDPFNALQRHTAGGRRLLGAGAWAFGVAGLIAALGVANAVVYGVMVLVASLSGACVLVAARLHRGTRGPRRADPPPLRPVAAASLEGAAHG